MTNCDWYGREYEWSTSGYQYIVAKSVLPKPMQQDADVLGK